MVSVVRLKVNWKNDETKEKRYQRSQSAQRQKDVRITDHATRYYHTAIMKVFSYLPRPQQHHQTAASTLSILIPNTKN